MSDGRAPRSTRTITTLAVLALALITLGLVAATHHRSQAATATSTPPHVIVISPPTTSDAAAYIQAALNGAPSGSTVQLPAGTFSLVADHVIGGDLDCNLNVPDGVTIKGAGIGQTVLVGNGSTSCNVVAAVHASGITVTNCTASSDYRHGFRFYGLDASHRVTNFAVSGCSARNNGEDGYLLDYIAASTLSDCTATGNGADGFELCGTSGVTIDRCTASGQANPYSSGFVCDGDAATFGPTSGNTISNCTASGNDYGYREWQGGGGNVVYGNWFPNNTNGSEFAPGTIQFANVLR